MGDGRRIGRGAGITAGVSAREGAAMIGGLVADLQRIPACQVVAFRDPRFIQLALGNCEIVEVLSRFAHDEEIERLAAECDATILIAPEFDGILWKLAQARDCCRRKAVVAIAGVYSCRGGQTANVRRS